MLKIILVAVALDGAVWLYNAQIGGVLLIILLILNFVWALSRSV